MQSDPVPGGAGAPSLAAAGPSGASRVAAGILASRLLGFVRDAMLARYLPGAQLDVFRQAMRSGNLIQNLLGEQTLSAAFIPQYSRLLEEGREEEAGRFAGAILGFMVVVAGLLTLAGVFLAEPIVALFNAGYLLDAARVAAGEATVDRFPLAVRVVRLLFPMAGLLVLSAWSVAVLNSHRRFFVSYFAPVVWNVAIITALVLAGQRLLGGPGDPSAPTLERVVLAGALGALLGGGLQFLAQLPFVLGVLRGFRLSLSTRVAGVRRALLAFWPMLAGRGAVQLSGHLDGFIASFLAAGAQGILGFSLTLYLLPLSLFGLSVAAAELPELSRGDGGGGGDVPDRIAGTVRRSAFFVVPTAVGYVCFGLLIVGAIYGWGAFGRSDVWLTYLVLATYSLGLPASGVTRQLNTLFYATGRTAVPARVGVERVLVSAALGGALALLLDRWAVGALVPDPDEELFLGAVGLAAGAAVGAWFELLRIRARLAAEHASVALPVRQLVAMGGAAVGAAMPAAALWMALPATWSARAVAPLVVGVYAGGYLGLTAWLGVSELGAWTAGLTRRRRG